MNSIRLISASAVLLCVLGARVVADDEITGWGKFVDPAGDCQVQHENGIVTITVPGSDTAHNLNPTPDYDNVLGPRLLQPVEGDFQIQVKVATFPRPKANTSVTKQGHSYVAAGLLIWQDETTFIRWLRAALGERGDLFVHGEPFKNGDWNTSTARVLVSSRLIPDKPTYLRFARGQGHFTFSWSTDGQKWTTYAMMSDDGYAEQLQVGIAVVNATNVQFAPQFEQLQLTGGGNK